MSNKIWRAGVLWDVEETDHRRRYTSRDDYAEVVIDENFVSHPDQLDRDTIKVNVSTRFYRSVGTKFDVRETSVPRCCDVVYGGEGCVARDGANGGGLDMGKETPLAPITTKIRTLKIDMPKPSTDYISPVDMARVFSNQQDLVDAMLYVSTSSMAQAVAIMATELNDRVSDAEIESESA